MSGNLNGFQSGSSGPGDMSTVTYDTDLNNIVDLSENAQQLGGQPGSYYRARANHTGTQLASTISDFNTAVDAAPAIDALQAASHTQGTDQTLDAGGSDEVSATDLREHLDEVSGNPHGVSIGNINSGTLVQLNSKLDVTLDSSSDPRTPLAHNHSTSDINSGTFADARISQSSVTQHQAAIDHNSLLNYSITQHRQINDSGTSTTDLLSASKIYEIVDDIQTGLDIHAPVDTVSTTNITLSGEQTLNSYLTNNSRVGVVGQTLQEENGIYVSSSGAWTRALDADDDDEITHGNSFDVLYGDKAGSRYLLVTHNPITVGTTALEYVELPGVVYGSTANTSCEGNDPRLPSQDENDALQGTNGTPSSSNRYVTNTDPRLHTQNTDTALDAGNPNEVTAADARAHLDATSSNPHGVTFSNLVPGSLANLNSVLTGATLDDASSARTPTAHATSHLQGGSDELDGDTLDIDFTPSSYTRDATAPASNVVHLAAHLRGIDNAIGNITFPVDDTTSIVQDPVDNTKQVRFDAGLITTGNVRIVSVPDANIEVDDKNSARTPLAHATSHNDGGSDELTVQSLGSGALDASYTISADGTGGWNTTKFNPLWGTEFQRAESLTPSLYVGTTLIDKISFTTTTLPIGTYRIDWCYSFNIDNTNASFLGAILVDGTIVHNTAHEFQESGDLPAPYNAAPWGDPSGQGAGTGSHQRMTEAGHHYITFGSAATHTLKIQYAGSTAADEVQIWNARIAIWRIS